MGVLAVHPIAPRSGEAEGPEAITAVRKWLVHVSSSLDTEHTIYASGLLPVRYAPLPENGFLTLRRISAAHHGSTPLAWVVTGTYSSAPIDRREQDKQDFGPLDRPATRRWSTVQYREAVEEDVDGNAVVNTAGDLYDPPPERDTANWTVTITKNVASVPPFIINYQNTLNDDDISIGGLTVAEGLAKINAIEIGDKMNESGVDFYQFSYTLEIKKAGWDLRLLQQGLRQKNEIDGTGRIPCVDNNGRPVSSPVLLDIDGIQQTDPAKISAVYVSHEIYESKDFSVLPGIDD